MDIGCGYPEIIDEADTVGSYPDQPLAYFIVQIDKSTCQSYNLKQNFFGYRGVPTSRTELLLQEIADAHGVFILVAVQATHTFDVNGCDILLKSGNCEAIALLYAQITSFATGSVLVTKFAMHERSNDVSCGRFAEILRGILMRA